MVFGGDLGRQDWQECMEDVMILANGHEHSVQLDSAVCGPCGLSQPEGGQWALDMNFER